MKEIKNIDLVLENCDVIEIVPEFLSYLSIENAKKNYFLNGNIINSYLIAEEIKIEIKVSFIYKSLSGKIMKVFDRLKYNDIVAIDINYKDGTNEYIYTDYKPDNLDRNLNQITIEKNNIIAIIICADELKRRNFWKNFTE